MYEGDRMDKIQEVQTDVSGGTEVNIEGTVALDTVTGKTSVRVFIWRDDKTFKANLNEDGTPDGVFTKDGADFYGGECMSFGYANKVYSDGTFDLSYAGKGKDVSESYPVTSSIPVTVFYSDGGRETIYKGSIDDVAAYEDVSDNCSAVIVHAQYAVWKTFYVYKK